MTKLMKWHVEEIMESFVVGGFVANDSEKFLAGSFILTSMIDTIKVDKPNKLFIIHTMSGSDYACLFEDIRISARFAEFSKDNLERMNISSDFIDEAIKLAHEKESFLVIKLESELLSGDLYLELGAGGIISVHFKYLDGVHRISSRVHSGMFVDSYLYCLSGVVDFRHYAFCGGQVNTYHMSDSIKRLVVNNIGSKLVTIDKKVYESGTTITCVTEENHPEGLVSPDAFNGKSWMTDFVKEGNSNV